MGNGTVVPIVVDVSVTVDVVVITTDVVTTGFDGSVVVSEDEVVDDNGVVVDVVVGIGVVVIDSQITISFILPFLHFTFYFVYLLL